MSQIDVQHLSALPQLRELERLIDLAGAHLQRLILGEVEVAGQRFALQAVVMGNPDPDVPALGIFGGVHGLERIGAEVAMAYLASLVMRLRWDSSLHAQLESLRIVFMPHVNPGGLWLGTRANPRGVDLMRNAPVDAQGSVPFLLGGHRVGPSLPWYRGRSGEAMEVESQALCNLVERELLSRPFAMAVDCHSGFGMNDRIWFPYAHTARPIAHLAEMHALCEVLNQTYAQHRYVFEPQSRQYLAHGDLWDHLYLKACQQAATGQGGVFLPLTLEMGSWIWVKKNPRQVFTREGIFNPLIPHRQQRVLRRHLAWMDFMARAAQSWQRWLPQGEARAHHHERALDRWYRRSRRAA